jgi:hypothetical protein
MPWNAETLEEGAVSFSAASIAPLASPAAARPLAIHAARVRPLMSVSLNACPESAMSDICSTSSGQGGGK